MDVICTAKTPVYTATGILEKNRYISKGDRCSINTKVNTNLLISVTYPTASGKRMAYLKSLENFTEA